MESEAIGIFFSILALSVAIGAISGVIYLFQEDEMNLINQRALSGLQDQCEYVCATGVGTKIPFEVTMHPGIILYTHDQKICMRDGVSISCEICPCTVSDYSLNLSTAFLNEHIGKHSYQCDFTKHAGGISIACQG